MPRWDMRIPMSLRAAAVAAATTLLLAGCSDTDGYAVFDREQNADDRLPELPDYAVEDVEVDSARHVGDHDGVGLWLIRSVEEPGICLLAYADEKAWVSGCGGVSGVGLTGTGVGSFWAVPDGQTSEDGDVQVSENIWTTGG